MRARDVLFDCYSLRTLGSHSLSVFARVRFNGVSSLGSNARAVPDKTAPRNRWGVLEDTQYQGIPLYVVCECTQYTLLFAPCNCQCGDEAPHGVAEKEARNIRVWMHILDQL
jgi:hypothetical protein